MDFSSFFSVMAWVLPVIFAVTFHEASHGWVAEKFGDETARVAGRVTFNPLKHIDMFGTVLLPALLLLAHSPVLLGYAKPVPVDFDRLQPQRLGMFTVAIAGPISNIIMALGSALFLRFSAIKDLSEMTWLQLNFFNAIIINCALAVFNMVPVLPLDGGRVLRTILTGPIGDEYEKSEPYGMMIILMLLFLPPLIGTNFFMDGLVFVNKWLLSGIFSVMGAA
jgi:Zn-dependent protease